MRRGARPRYSSSPDMRELACRMALSRPCPAPWAGGASEDGGRRYRPQRASRPPGAPEGRALDIQEPNSAIQAGEVSGVLGDPSRRALEATDSTPTWSGSRRSSRQVSQYGRRRCQTECAAKVVFGERHAHCRRHVRALLSGHAASPQVRGALALIRRWAAASSHGRSTASNGVSQVAIRKRARRGTGTCGRRPDPTADDPRPPLG